MAENPYKLQILLTVLHVYYSGFRFIGPHPFEGTVRHCYVYPFLLLAKWTNYVADPFNRWPHEAESTVAQYLNMLISFRSTRVV